MLIRRSPDGAGHTRPQPGRDQSERLVAINRNRWSQSPVRAFAMMATEMSAAIKPYSIAVAPLSSRRKRLEGRCRSSALAGKRAPEHAICPICPEQDSVEDCAVIPFKVLKLPDIVNNR
jgi:hypothetical protein